MPNTSLAGAAEPGGRLRHSTRLRPGGEGNVKLTALDQGLATGET